MDDVLRDFVRKRIKEGSSRSEILRVASSSGFKREDVELAIADFRRKRITLKIAISLIILLVVLSVASVSALLYRYYNPSFVVPLSSVKLSGGVYNNGVLYFEKQGDIKADLNIDFIPERVVVIAKGSQCFTDVADVYKYNGRNYVYIPVASKPVVKDGKVDFVHLSFEEVQEAKKRYGWPSLSISADNNFMGKKRINSGDYSEFVFDAQNKGKLFKVLMLRTSQFCEGRKLWIKGIRIEGRR